MKITLNKLFLNQSTKSNNVHEKYYSTLIFFLKKCVNLKCGTLLLNRRFKKDVLKGCFKRIADNKQQILFSAQYQLKILKQRERKEREKYFTIF